MANPALDITSGEELHVMGWGETDSGEYSGVLQEAGVKYLTNAECRDTPTNDYYNLDFIDVDTYMCTASTERTELCGGDLGGPLIAKGGDANGDVLVGVASSAWTETVPDVYSRIAAHRAWINAVVTEYEGVTRHDFAPTTSAPASSVLQSQGCFQFCTL